MESTTIALLALTVSFLALFISPYFAHQHKVAELRQRWIDAVRQNVAELIAMVTSTPVKESEKSEISPEKNRALKIQVDKLRWSIELLLDPGDDSHKGLVALIGQYCEAFDEINNMMDRDPRTCDEQLKITGNLAKDIAKSAQTIAMKEWTKSKSIFYPLAEFRKRLEGWD